MQIAPHHTISKKKIKKGRTPAMKAGLQYAKRRLWDDAKISWETVLTDNSPKSRKDRLHAKYQTHVVVTVPSPGVNISNIL